MYYERSHLQTKKEYYKRLAQIKKNKWMKNHSSSEDDHLKPHYIVSENLNFEEQDKTKKTYKGEIRIEQKLRNRAAAQESRQRHRSYVAELEKKVKIYEQLLEKQGSLCKNCKKNIISESNIMNETIIVQEFSDHSSSLRFFNPIESKDEILNSFLSDQMIRIDNKDASTPFALFFIICLLGVLAIFGLRAGDLDMAPSLLANYHSAVNQLLQMQDTSSHQKYHMQLQPKYVQISTIESYQKWQNLKQQNNFDSFVSISVVKDYNISTNWTDHNDNIQTEKSLSILNKTISQQKGPQVLQLKTGKETNKSQLHLIVNTEDSLSHNSNIQLMQKIEVISPQSLKENL